MRRYYFVNGYKSKVNCFLRKFVITAKIGQTFLFKALSTAYLQLHYKHLHEVHIWSGIPLDRDHPWQLRVPILHYLGRKHRIHVGLD